MRSGIARPVVWLQGRPGRNRLRRAARVLLLRIPKIRRPVAVGGGSFRREATPRRAVDQPVARPSHRRGPWTSSSPDLTDHETRTPARPAAKLRLRPHGKLNRTRRRSRYDGSRDGRCCGHRRRDQRRRHRARRLGPRPQGPALRKGRPRRGHEFALRQTRARRPALPRILRVPPGAGGFDRARGAVALGALTSSGRCVSCCRTRPSSVRPGW